MAQPRRRPDALSSAVITLRITEDERELIEQHAAAAGVTPSAWVRDAALAAAGNGRARRVARRRDRRLTTA